MPKREGDAELVHVAPRAAADEVGADEEPDAEHDEDGQVKTWAMVPAVLSAGAPRHRSS